MKLDKKQRELVGRINICVMTYLYFEQMTKHWNEGKWTPQFREGWQTCVMRISKDLAGYEHFGEMPSLRELKVVVEHYTFNPYETRCTKCNLRGGTIGSIREQKKYLKETVGKVCDWCKKGKIIQVKPHHCEICDKIAEREAKANA